MNLKQTVLDRVQALVGSEAVIFADQNAPRPVLPYWTVRVSVSRGLGMDAVSQGVNDDGDQQVDGVREGTVQVQRIGVGSEAKCADLRDQLSMTSVREAWQLAKVTVYDIGEVKNVPFLLDDNIREPRAALDLFIRFGSRLLDRVGIIETVDITTAYETVDETPEFDANPDLGQIISCGILG